MLLLTSFISWWYGDGWRRQIQKISGRIDSVTDYFSFSLLLKTLFSPFRQISAGSVDGSLDVKFRAMIDKLISRIIGALLRLFIIGFGCMTLVLLVVYGLFFIIAWALMPVLPIVGLVLAVSGWTP